MGAFLLAFDLPLLTTIMSDLPTLLRASLDPSTRKQAEANLTEVSKQQGFLVALLRLVLEPSQDRAVRLAGSVYLKNVVKLRWEEVRSGNA